MWEMLSKDKESNRKEILHNIDDIYGSASLTSGIWKIHKGKTLALNMNANNKYDFKYSQVQTITGFMISGMVLLVGMANIMRV